MPSPIELSEFNLGDIGAVALGLAVRHRALVQLLIDKGVITLDELNEKADEIVDTQMDILLKEAFPSKMPPDC